MSRFRATFSNRHAVFTVIHVVAREQARRNVDIARSEGADGAFLISHGQVEDEELLDIYQELTSAAGGFWLGVNCLSLPVEEVFRRGKDHLMGVWADDALIDERHDEQPEARTVLDTQRENGWQGLYFGGVAFKYQRAVKNLGRVAALARNYMDVVTTSGPGTSQAADPDKVRTMKEALGDYPLALASGVSPENVNDYLEWVDALLVASAISYTFEELDPARVRDLVRIVRAW